MTAITTNAATTALTTQDILDVTPSNGDLEILVDDIVLHVVGADGSKNVIFVDPNRDVHTEMTFEIRLDDFLSLEEISNGYCRLIRRDDKHEKYSIVRDNVVDLPPTGIVVPLRSQNEASSSSEEDLELPF